MCVVAMSVGILGREWLGGGGGGCGLEEGGREGGGGGDWRLNIENPNLWVHSRIGSQSTITAQGTHVVVNRLRGNKKRSSGNQYWPLRLIPMCFSMLGWGQSQAGPLMGVPYVACELKKNTMMSHDTIAYFPPCHMSNLWKGHVTIH